jgi:HEAT repeat protein
MGIFGPPNIAKMAAKRDVNGLLKLLNNPKSSLSPEAARALGGIGDPRAIPSLVAALNREGYVQEAAVQALDKIGWQPEQSPLGATYFRIKVNLLISVILHEYYDKEALKNAEDTLAQINDPRAFHPIHNILDDTRYKNAHELNKAAASALGLIGNPRAIPRLVKLLLQGGPAESAAIKALIQIGRPAIETLIAVIKKNDNKILIGVHEEEAVMVLIKIGKPAEPLLISSLKDEDIRVRWAVVRALDGIGWHPSRDEEINAYYWATKEEWNECIKIGKSAIEPLIATLNDHYACDGAARALGQIGDTSSVEPLIALLKNYGSGRKAAAYALGQLGDARAIPALIAVIEDGSYIKEAADALDQLGWRPGQDEIGAWYWLIKEDYEKCAAVGNIAIELLISDLLLTVFRDHCADRQNKIYKSLERFGDNVVTEAHNRFETKRKGSITPKDRDGQWEDPEEAKRKWEANWGLNE